MKQKWLLGGWHHCFFFKKFHSFFFIISQYIFTKKQIFCRISKLKIIMGIFSLHTLSRTYEHMFWWYIINSCFSAQIKQQNSSNFFKLKNVIYKTVPQNVIITMNRIYLIHTFLPIINWQLKAYTCKGKILQTPTRVYWTK